MKQKPLVSQRIVCDQLSDYTNQLHEYKIEKKLFLSCKSARMRYENHLREESDKKEESQKSKKRKALNDEIATAKKARQDLIDCIASLEADITKYSIEAEKLKDFTLLTKANSFRKTITEKEESIKITDIALKKLDQKLKAL